ncbi:MAG: hypothetical protein ACFFEF_00335 [Candidatus Thorarchaeota archaeon]
MPVTEITLGVLLTFIGMIISLIIGSLGGKEYRWLVPSVLLFGIGIPLLMFSTYLSFSSHVVAIDWPRSAFWSEPYLASAIGCWAGGFLGIKAGSIWSRDDDRSCLQCSLVPVFLLLLGSIILLAMP